MRPPDSLLRHQDILPPDKTLGLINIIGAGATGSFVALALSKMGFDHLMVWDYDKVAPENINAQLYGPPTIGQPKTFALARLISGLSGGVIIARQEKYVGEKLDGIVISAVDSMETRRQIWEAQIGNELVPYVIDPRMGAESALMYVMNPNNEKDMASYENTLYSDLDAVLAPCTAKSTAYCALLLAGLVAKAVKDIVTGHSYPRVSMWNIADNSFQTWGSK